VSWSFVGSANSSGNGVTTLAVAKPAGVQGGDLVVVAFAMSGSGATATVSIPGFATVDNAGGGAKPTGSFTDQFWSAVHAAGGSPGSATTDASTYTATFNVSAFTECLCYVLRSTLGSWVLVGHAEYHGNAASTYSTACPDPAYTPASASNATVWGYAGQNASLGTPGTTFSGTGPAALSNFATSSATFNGGGVGAGWLQSTSAPGGATASQAIDATDFVIEVAEQGGLALHPPYKAVQSVKRAAYY
jgi:hypothetical protein